LISHQAVITANNLVDDRILQTYIDTANTFVSKENKRKEEEELMQAGIAAFDKKSYHKSKKIFKIYCK